MASLSKCSSRPSSYSQSSCLQSRRTSLPSLLLWALVLLSSSQNLRASTLQVSNTASLHVHRRLIKVPGGSLNPARSFGPAVILGSFAGYHWIYWVGPFLGALLAVAFYKIVKGLEYETVNPGQDSEKEAETFRNDEEPRGVPTVARRFDGPASSKTVDRKSNDERV